MNWQEIIKKGKSKKESINKWLLSSTIGTALLTLFVVGGEAYQYFYKDQPVDFDAIHNVIKEDNNQTLLSSSFSNDTLRADLIMPETPVGVYKLVRIRSTNHGTHYDLMVMTIADGEILFVDTVETAARNEWVFTGPPGKYSIRLTVFNPETGFNAVTGSVVIGEAPVPPQTPPQSTFNLQPLNVKVGENAVLNWTTRFATSASINGQVVELNGTKVVNHTTPGKYPYTLTALNNHGLSVTKTVELEVVGNGPGPVVVPAELKNMKYGFGELAFLQVTEKITDPQMKALKEEIANNFEAVAAGIAAGSWQTPQQANTELQGRNRLTFANKSEATFNTWRDTFFKEWAARATALNKSGQLPNVVGEYREVYIETVKGLRAAK